MTLSLVLHYMTDFHLLVIERDMMSLSKEIKICYQRKNILKNHIHVELYRLFEFEEEYCKKILNPECHDPHLILQLQIL